MPPQIQKGCARVHYSSLSSSLALCCTGNCCGNSTRVASSRDTSGHCLKLLDLLQCDGLERHDLGFAQHFS